MKTNKNIALAVATVLTASLIIGCGVNKSDMKSTLSDPEAVVSDVHASDETNENDDIDQTEKNEAGDENKIERSEEWPIYQLKENENYLYDPQKDIMRIHLESTDQYYKKVDGIHEDDVFEGLMYGGYNYY